jgi:hypothetical protein
MAGRMPKDWHMSLNVRLGDGTEKAENFGVGDIF